ncbi:MAG: hypothetical protein K9G67_13930 [Bacteroidales bacterium]|nr:hypothetical protein [Bacteroidales bacterium]MCF8345516.1 hypothetical protein [Bacteroidales bacterium]MCF8352155.1 hypothetical protein [Bacteroidales bacterium]MCF8377451.1 hypothetical protein [Bacteroidales bacterium]MCF8401552.1 hypothetical protein [Bacteroidales bacterium]
MKFFKSRWLNYALYLLSVIIVILILFNVYFTFRIHNELVNFSSKQGKWPAGSYVYDPVIGFDFAPNISGPIGDGSFYVKSHELGYRIPKDQSSKGYRPGGVLSLGCSFTYGDEVEAEETFTQLIADSLNLAAYNYGICSFSYIHALLKAEELEREGILDRLRPKYVVLGCWKGLSRRSKSPFPPIASKTIQFTAAYLKKDGDSLLIPPPMKVKEAFDLVTLYQKKGPELSFGKFFRIFFAAPKYVYLYIKSRQSDGKTRSYGTAGSLVTDVELYDFYFGRIEKLFGKYNSRIIALYMPSTVNDHPGEAIRKALKKHPDIILVDGMKAIKEFDVPPREYKGIHPQPAAHEAYAWATIKEIRQKKTKGKYYSSY